MRSRRRQHPNYKAYLSKQLRILQEKYPFLSSQQIKAKICSSWESFSPKQKDEWGNAIGRRNLERNNGKAKANDSLDISHNSEESSTCESQTDDNIPYCEQYHKISSTQENRKRVSFLESISSPSEDHSSEDSPSQKADKRSKLWPVLNDFNAIMAHKLDVEQGVPQDDNQMKQQQDSRPLFGDLSTIFSTKSDNSELVENLDNETDEEHEDSEGKDGLMCSLFENLKPKFHSTDARSLSCLDQSEDIQVARLFEEDDKFFA